MFGFQLGRCVEKVNHSAKCRSVFNTNIMKLTPFSSYTVVQSDVVETVTSETETWLKFRDETETLS